MTVNGRHYPLLGQRKFGAGLPLLRRRRDLWAIYRRQRLAPQLREEIMLAAAGADSSRQCSYAHRQWAESVGVTEGELAALENLDFTTFDRRRWAAFAWAQAYARNDLGTVPDDVEAAFRHYFDAQERADIELAARTMYWLNETSNSVDALLSRLRREPLPGSTLTTELVASLLYAIVAPVLFTWLSIRQGYRPIRMFRGMRPFFREFETRGPHTISGPGVRYSGPIS
ncbi:MAG: carboxymuconolactone decarboxylase family protein [Actinomycetes bacterium]